MDEASDDPFGYMSETRDFDPFGEVVDVDQYEPMKQEDVWGRRCRCPRLTKAKEKP